MVSIIIQRRLNDEYSMSDKPQSQILNSENDELLSGTFTDVITTPLPNKNTFRKRHV